MPVQSRYRKILVPLDGSGWGQRAIPHAVDIARANGDSEITLLHVFVPPTREFPAQIALAGQDNQVQQAREQIEQYLNGLRAELQSERCNVRTHISEGANVPNLICEYVQQESINLIVMSTHGRTGFSRLVFGSVARDVMECVEVPVLLVRPDKE